MSKFLNSKFALVLFVMCISTIGAEAHAEVCGKIPTIKEAFKKADVVFLGTVTGIKDTKTFNRKTSRNDVSKNIVFRVNEVFKGKGLENRGSKGFIIKHDVGTSSVIGSEYLVYAQKQGNHLYSACSRTSRPADWRMGLLKEFKGGAVKSIANNEEKNLADNFYNNDWRFFSGKVVGVNHSAHANSENRGSSKVKFKVSEIFKDVELPKGYKKMPLKVGKVTTLSTSCGQLFEADREYLVQAKIGSMREDRLFPHDIIADYQIFCHPYSPRIDEIKQLRVLRVTRNYKLND